MSLDRMSIGDLKDRKGALSTEIATLEGEIFVLNEEYDNIRAEIARRRAFQLNECPVFQSVAQASSLLVECTPNLTLEQAVNFVKACAELGRE